MLETVITSESRFATGESSVVILTDNCMVFIPGNHIKAVLARLQVMDLKGVEQRHHAIHDGKVSWVKRLWQWFNSPVTGF